MSGVYTIYRANFKEEKCNHETSTISKLNQVCKQLVGELNGQEEKDDAIQSDIKQDITK